ncbi:MAG TPA: cation:proton antiporter [Ilumatobacteraceae bacterium]|jgi:Kef-type K+ transport system membrane component KefB
MPQLSFANLAICLSIAFGTRLLLGFVPRIRLPGEVVEIVVGIVFGPAVLGWVEVDEPVKILALVGLAFTLFLAGLELDLTRLRGSLLRVAGSAMALSAALAIVVSVVLASAGLIDDARLVAVALCATSLGLVVPVTKQGGFEDRQLGQLVIAGATLGDFGAIIALSLLFSRDAATASTRFTLLGAFVVLIALAAWIIRAGGRRPRVADVIARLADTTAQIRIRGVVLMIVAFALLAERTGLETILGCFVAGAVVGTVDHDSARNHPLFRVKLDAIGFGFLIPVFFVSAGIRFDLRALLNDTSTLALVPLFLVALLVVRGVPALLYRGQLASPRDVAIAGLLQATSLPFIVTATMIGVEIGALSAGVAAAFVGAGLLSALIFPVVALTLAGRNDLLPAGTALA